MFSFSETVSKCPPEYRLRIHEVPREYHEPYIFTGYRKPHCSIRQAVSSVFYLTNETVNFWTHFVLSGCIFASTYRFFTDARFVSDPYHWPFLVYLSTMYMWPLISSLAHLFNVISEEVRHVTFLIDYLGISLFSFGCSSAYYAYGSDRAFMESWYGRVYIWIGFVGAFVCVSSGCISRIMPPSKLQWSIRVMGFVVSYVISAWPLFDRLARHYLEPKIEYVGNRPIDNQLALVYHQRQTLCTVIGFVAYGLHVPERFWPGNFDIFGNSHQILHFCGILVAYYQIRANYVDMINRRPLLRERIQLQFGRIDVILCGMIVLIDVVIVFVSAMRVIDRLRKAE